MNRWAVPLALGALFVLAAPAGAQGVGNPIVPVQAAPTTNNITVNVTPPPPDPAATQSMYAYTIAVTERDHAAAPVTIATHLLSGANIWTRTPLEHFDIPVVRDLRTAARLAAMGLFILGVLWTGIQLLIGTTTGHTSMQQLLPLVVAGFLLAVYSTTIVHRAVELNNWLCERLGDPSLADFSASALELPETPTASDSSVAGIIAIPAGFISGMVTSVVYAVVLLILELKLIFREGVLLVADVVMPISGILWAFGITRGWGIILFRLFFGWLFGQPLMVAALSLASGLLTLMNLNDGPGQVFVKVAILVLSLKLLSIFAGGMGGGGMFGLAGLLFLLRRGMGVVRHTSAGGTAPGGAPATGSGMAGGTGTGSAATGRPWRPSLGMA